PVSDSSSASSRCRMSDGRGGILLLLVGATSRRHASLNGELRPVVDTGPRGATGRRRHSLSIAPFRGGRRYSIVSDLLEERGRSEQMKRPIDRKTTRSRKEGTPMKRYGVPGIVALLLVSSVFAATSMGASAQDATPTAQPTFPVRGIFVNAMTSYSDINVYVTA